MSDRSEAQKAASRENGRKSRGPTTEEGKKKSRQNALKHGLAGQGIVLPDDLKQEVEAEILIYERGLKPQGEFEQRLVHKAAVSSAKFMRMAAAELARAYDRQRQAPRQVGRPADEIRPPARPLPRPPPHRHRRR